MTPHKPFTPRYTRRASWHDYRSRCIYMITIPKASESPAFSNVIGTPRAPKVELTPIGKIIDEGLNALPEKYPELTIFRYVIMPDHIHFIIQVTRSTTYHIGTAIGYFKGACSRRAWELTGTPDKPLFGDRFHDRILMGSDQLEVMKQYIYDNPRRLLIKRAFPDLFQRRVGITINGVRYDALGNVFLLRNPLIEQVRVSRRFTTEQLEHLDRQWRFVIEEGGVLVSPFISPKEKIYRDLAINNGGNVIIIEENGMGERYKPIGRYFDLCAEGRLLIIAPVEHHLNSLPMTRKKALHLNDLAATISKGEFTVSLNH